MEGQRNKERHKQTERQAEEQSERFKQTEGQTVAQLSRKSNVDRHPVIAHINQRGKFGFFQAKDATLASVHSNLLRTRSCLRHTKRQKFHAKTLSTAHCALWLTPSPLSDVTVKMQITRVEQTTVRYIRIARIASRNCVSNCTHYKHLEESILVSHKSIQLVACNLSISCGFISAIIIYLAQSVSAIIMQFILTVAMCFIF